MVEVSVEFKILKASKLPLKHAVTSIHLKTPMAIGLSLKIMQDKLKLYKLVSLEN